MSALALARLLQLASPALPVGAYTYSQGLEWAVECGDVRDEASAGRWIADLLCHAIGRFEAPLVAALMRAWAAHDTTEIARLNAEFLASRESAELRAETVQMGFSLRRLIADLRDPELHRLQAILTPAAAVRPEPVEGHSAAGFDKLSPNGNARAFDEIAFPTAWSGIAQVWGIPLADAVQAYLWSWAENQVMAALKAVPLGQAAGQRLLAALGAQLPALAEQALHLPESAWANLTPAFAIASARHETQYSRLFRS